MDLGSCYGSCNLCELFINNFLLNYLLTSFVTQLPGLCRKISLRGSVLFWILIDRSRVYNYQSFIQKKNVSYLKFDPRKGVINFSSNFKLRIFLEQITYKYFDDETKHLWTMVFTCIITLFYLRSKHIIVVHSL